MNFVYFKTVTGLSLVLVLVILLVNLLSLENMNLVMKQRIK